MRKSLLKKNSWENKLEQVTAGSGEKDGLCLLETNHLGNQTQAALGTKHGKDLANAVHVTSAQWLLYYIALGCQGVFSFGNLCHIGLPDNSWNGTT